MMHCFKGLFLLFCVLHLHAKPLFEMTPPMYASFMVQNLSSNLPQKFTYQKMELSVTSMYQEKHQIHLQATTPHYKKIVEELKKHRTLPEELKRQCKEFSTLSLVNQGVEYILHVNVKAEKSLDIVYDKEACVSTFDPQKKIFIDGYNAYGVDKNGLKRK